MSDEVIIELSGVDVVHEDATEVVLARQVDWRIARGEFWAVGADQASGKTSVLTTAAGLNRPCGGTLKIFGKQLCEAAEQDQVDWRLRIGFVFENGGRLLSHLTVAENIALSLEYHRQMEEDKLATAVDQLLERTGLKPFAALRPSSLNLRLRQRTALARSLSLGPEVLFLDNPLNGLAPRECRWWLDFLRDLKSEQSEKQKPMTIVVSCSDFRGWRHLANRFAIIQNEKFHVIGDRAQLDATEEPGVREFIASTI